MRDNNQIDNLCKIRDVYRAIYEFEIGFQERYDLCLNEGMLLCSLNEKERTSTDLATVLGLTTSNTSKVIKLVEKKGLVERKIGEVDKRQMYFSLTQEGKKRISSIKCNELEIPELLKDVIR